MLRLTHQLTPSREFPSVLYLLNIWSRHSTAKNINTKSIHLLEILLSVTK